MEITYQINQYLDYCRDIRQMSSATINNKENILRRFVKLTQIAHLGDLTNGAIGFYVKKLFELGVSESSVNIYLSTIISLIKFHRNAGLMDQIDLNLLPHFKIQRPKRKFYTKEEITQVLSHAREPENLMIKIMFETGMRINELKNLKVENFTSNKITFIGKGDKPREVYITKDTLGDFKKYLAEHEIDHGYTWCINNGSKTLNGEPSTVATIRKNLQKVFEKAGFEGFYPHALRHSFATDLQKKGATIPEIKEMMGHSNIATTERYLHGFEGRLEELFEKYR